MGYESSIFFLLFSGPFKFGDNRLSLSPDFNEQSVLVAKLLHVTLKLPEIDPSIDATGRFLELQDQMILSRAPSMHDYIREYSFRFIVLAIWI
ncbi:hypothetical protein FB597_1213 [Herbaspirillum sp. SJZ099]|nr:hypothetical protein FB597_1213 [Herbaspirillum sp. SJZ099]